jgi:hypothetical protein
LIFNLAISNILLLISTTPMAVISSFKTKWIFGQIG